MYNDYFGFSESPFNITPNPRFYYRTRSYDEVLEVVQHGIEARKGLMVIVGEAGSGKTLFLKSLVGALGSNVKPVIVPNPHADLDEILGLLAERLDLQGPLNDRTARLERLTAHLAKERSDGHVVALLIDEAQDLEAQALDELRILANLEVEGDALLPIVLIGQVELNLKLDDPSASRIKQRVALTRNIYPLIRKEVGAYIAFRLKVAGYDQKGLFDAEAIETIAAHSGGIPRMVNAICDNALLRAYLAQQRVISAPIVEQVARELRVSSPLSAQKQTAAAALEPRHFERTVPLNYRREERAMLLAPDEQEDEPPLGGESPLLGEPEWQDDGETRKRTPASRPEERSGLLRGLPSMRTGGYAFAGAIAVLLVALNIVNSSQLAGIYSALAARTRSTAADPAVSQSSSSHSASGAKPDRTLSTRSTANDVSSRLGHLNSANSKPGSEVKANGAYSASGSAPVQPAPRPETRLPEGQAADTFAARKSESKPAAVTLEVVARSKVRAKPNDESEIIAELEPGNRVTVLAKSRDYYHVRSVEDRTIRGYVHREDAFFESTNRR
ncbi:MAG TPA: AAA family ATPase [Candidatus Binatia bacterium]|nr:AAA family ATPase [Candidatus Binatia bacterium]